MDHENTWNYSLVAELQKTLSEKNERVNRLEKMWNEFELLIYNWSDFCKEKWMNNEAKLLDELLDEMRKIEKENEQ